MADWISKSPPKVLPRTIEFGGKTYKKGTPYKSMTFTVTRQFDCWFYVLLDGQQISERQCNEIWY